MGDGRAGHIRVPQCPRWWCRRAVPIELTGRQEWGMGMGTGAGGQTKQHTGGATGLERQQTGTPPRRVDPLYRTATVINRFARSAAGEDKGPCWCCGMGSAAVSLQPNLVVEETLALLQLIDLCFGRGGHGGRGGRACTRRACRSEGELLPQGAASDRARRGSPGEGTD